MLLFLATAAVVVWQNTRLGVLWDLSYILENSYRISIGDIPYRDFPFPYAPLTFLIQAALIKLLGRVYFHHVIYSAIVGGAATVLAWRILLNILRNEVPCARLVAFLLSAPLIVLGIYCVYPHPFYDPDCTFAILLCIFLLQRLERRSFRPLPTFLTGVLLVIPPLVKQNTGLAFLGSVGLALVALAGIEAWYRRPLGAYAWMLAGIATGVLLALMAIEITAGLTNYAHWTMEFAASRRLPHLMDMLGVYRNSALLGWIAAFMAGSVLLRVNLKSTQKSVLVLRLLSVCLMTAPFAWASIYLLIETDSSERAEQLLELWPFLLIVSLIFALMNVRRSSGIALVLPFILISTVHGAFLSQQLWGSTYAVWPLLMILLAFTVRGFVVRFPWPTRERAKWEIVTFASVAAVSMLISGASYVRSHERLDYANLSDGKMAWSTLPALRGLSIRGPWIPEFEQLVRFADREIPRDDGLLMIPGEDLFYYTTGRRPRFPVLMFDHTVNPYSAEEIVKLSRERGIRWLVVKRKLQLQEEPLEGKEHLLDLLRQDFTQVSSLDNYDVYRRNSP